MKTSKITTYFVTMVTLRAAAAAVSSTVTSRETLMLEFMEELTHSPVLLYQCYRNGTTFEPKDSRNQAVLFDGLGNKMGDIYTKMWYENSLSGKITRDTAHLTYNAETDTVTFAATGKTSEVTLVAFRDFKAHYITEPGAGYAPVGKIYDVDLNCKNGQDLYKEVCPDGCGMHPVRNFNI